MSELEDYIGIKNTDLTRDEKEAVDRIKRAYYLLTTRERHGSPTDIIMDLSVAIACELRLVRAETVRQTLLAFEEHVTGKG